MKTEKNSGYPSTKFVILIDPNSVASAKKKYLIWITIVSALFCLTVPYLYYKIIISPNSFSDEIPRASYNYTSVSTNHSFLKFYNPKSLLARFMRKSSNDQWEFKCEESQQKLESIPEIFIRDIFKKYGNIHHIQENFENIYDYINLDILLHYENIINRNTPINLKVTFTEYQLKLSSVRSSEDFKSFLKVLKSNKFNFHANFLKSQLFELSNFENIFALTDEFYHWYNYLNQLNVLLSGYEHQKVRRFFVNCTEENFEKFTEETQKRLFHFVYSFRITVKKLQEINEVINKCAKPVQINFFNSSVIFYSRVLLLSSVNKKIGLRISELKSVYIFASHVVYLDEDVQLAGVDLVIISPNWVFFKKIKINLNGSDGRNKSDSVSIGRSGEPGYPGGNAGDFLGIGNPHEKFLLITANGGKGGNGQNGAKGQDGSNNTLPDPPVSKPTCITKVNSFKNKFKQSITHYKIYNEAGCGKPGANGGVGGRGGAGGLITLINSSSVTIKRGLNGMSGLGGKGGVGGIGGRSGCFYEVFDVDDEILHLVTRVKCPAGNVLPSGELGKDNYNAEGQALSPVKENLSLHKSLLLFTQSVGEDSNIFSLLKSLIYNEPNSRSIVFEYKLLKGLDKIELYEMFNKKINKYMQQPSVVLKYLKSVVLGRMAILRESINFYVIDFKKYLNVLQRNIETTNEDTKELQSVVYLKRKLKMKLEPIKQSLELIKFSLTRYAADLSYRESHTNSSQEKKNVCNMMMTVDVLYFLLNETSADVKSSEFHHLLMSSSANCNRNIMSTNKTNNLFRIFKNLSNKQDVRKYLLKLRDVLSTSELSNVEKKIHEALTDELERIIALYNFIMWERLTDIFLKSLSDLKGNKNESEEVEFLRRELIEVMTALEYSLVTDTVRQIVYPHSNLNTWFHFSNVSVTDSVLPLMTFLKSAGQQTNFCKNQHKAIFDKNSAFGEFYFWPNVDIRAKLEILFSGSEINLRSNLINHHVFDKNFVQFTTLKLEFECWQSGSTCQEQLDRVLSNFRIQIVHSGYSFYNWEGETKVVVSDKVSLEYSFKMRNNEEPEVYNSLYKKCQDGEIKLSPFTTWTISLLPINEYADFIHLSSFASFVNLRLTGKGTFTS